MNKKLISALTAVTLSIPTTAYAAGIQNRIDSTPAVAILDTAIDTSLPAFQGKIIQEVCILEWTTCPNGKSFMEGPGSASMPANLITQNGFDHGTFMTSVFLQTNPNVNVDCPPFPVTALLVFLYLIMSPRFMVNPHFELRL